MWGANNEGQLGIGSLEDVYLPTIVQVQPIEDPSIKLVALGGHSGGGGNGTLDGGHTIVVTEGEQIYAWGDNFFGQLGKIQEYYRMCGSCEGYTPNRYDNETETWSNRWVTPQHIGALQRDNMAL